MATQKQIEANQRNAQLSTGPKTDEGKSITRLNAKRDGFTGQVTTLSDDDRPVFEKFRANLVADLQPKTTMELTLAHAIAWDSWRLNNLRAVELNMYALGAENSEIVVDCDNPQLQTAMSNAATFAAESPKFALMSIYEQRTNRSLHKNLATLRELQAERKRHEEKDRAEEVILARYSDIKGLTYQAPTRPTANGSVFSNEEILGAANRLTTLKVAKSEIWNTPLKVQFAGAASSNLVNWPEPDAA